MHDRYTPDGRGVVGCNRKAHWMLTVGEEIGILRANNCTSTRREAMNEQSKTFPRGPKSVGMMLSEASEPQCKQMHGQVQEQMQEQVQIKKQEPEKQIVYGEVYAPTVPDAHGDYMSEEVIMETAYDFMKHQRLKKIDVEHNEHESGAYVVESFIARKGDPDFLPGSWVIGVHIPDPILWDQVKRGKLNGFSLMGMGLKKKTTVEIDVPDVITGMTTETEGHAHEFVVRYGENGKFLGGETTPAEDGHAHKIVSGTVTSEENGHTHRFSFVEGVLSFETVN